MVNIAIYQYIVSSQLAAIFTTVLQGSTITLQKQVDNLKLDTANNIITYIMCHQFLQCNDIELN